MIEKGTLKLLLGLELEDLVGLTLDEVASVVEDADFADPDGEFEGEGDELTGVI